MKLTNEVFSEVVEAYSAGVKVRDIARNLGVNIRWVFDCVEKIDQDKQKDVQYVVQS